jgi:hypothetical protein
LLYQDKILNINTYMYVIHFLNKIHEKMKVIFIYFIGKTRVFVHIKTWTCNP